MRKFDRSHYGPSWTEVILGALLSVVIGVVLAAAYFVFKPVARVKEIPKEPAPDMVYYIEGSRDYSNARRLIAKEKFFVRGGTVVVNEDELNTAARVDDKKYFGGGGGEGEGREGPPPRAGGPGPGPGGPGPAPPPPRRAAH